MFEIKKPDLVNIPPVERRFSDLADSQKESMRQKSEDAFGRTVAIEGFKEDNVGRLSLDFFETGSALPGMPEKKEDYYKKIKEASADQVIPIYHGSRGDYRNIPNIIDSPEGGCKIGNTKNKFPMFSIVPAGSYWGNDYSVGFEYVFKRGQIAFPDDKIMAETVIVIDKDGLAYAKAGMESLPLDQFEGRVLLGPRSEVPEDGLRVISACLDKKRASRTEVKPIFDSLEKSLIRALSDAFDSEQIAELFPITQDKLKNGELEKELTRLAQKSEQDAKKIGMQIGEKEGQLQQATSRVKGLQVMIDRVLLTEGFTWKVKFLRDRFMKKNLTPLAQSQIAVAVDNASEQGLHPKEEAIKYLNLLMGLWKVELDNNAKALEAVRSDKKRSEDQAAAINKSLEILAMYKKSFDTALNKR